VKTLYQSQPQEGSKRPRPADLLAPMLQTLQTKVERVERATNRTLSSRKTRLLDSLKMKLNLVPTMKKEMMLRG